MAEPVVEFCAECIDGVSLATRIVKNEYLIVEILILGMMEF